MQSLFTVSSPKCSLFCLFWCCILPWRRRWSAHCRAKAAAVERGRRGTLCGAWMETVSWLGGRPFGPITTTLSALYHPPPVHGPNGRPPSQLTNEGEGKESPTDAHGHEDDPFYAKSAVEVEEEVDEDEARACAEFLGIRFQIESWCPRTQRMPGPHPHQLPPPPLPRWFVEQGPGGWAPSREKRFQQTQQEALRPDLGAKFGGHPDGRKAILARNSVEVFMNMHAQKAHAVFLDVKDILKQEMEWRCPARTSLWRKITLCPACTKTRKGRSHECGFRSVELFKSRHTMENWGRVVKLTAHGMDPSQAMAEMASEAFASTVLLSAAAKKRRRKINWRGPSWWALRTPSKGAQRHGPDMLSLTIRVPATLTA